MTDWAALATGCEHKAVDEVQTLGLETYLPQEAVVRAKRGRIVHEARPLFPGYAFFELTCRWFDVLKLEHVDDVLMTGVQPLPIPAVQLDHVRELEAPDGLIHFDVPKRRRFRKGQMVRANGGPLTGIVGKVTALVAHDRIVALFDLLGRQTPVTLSEAELTVAF